MIIQLGKLLCTHASAAITQSSAADDARTHTNTRARAGRTSGAAADGGLRCQQNSAQTGAELAGRYAVVTNAQANSHMQSTPKFCEQLWQRKNLLYLPHTTLIIYRRA